jgi:hypothetical protein
MGVTDPLVTATCTECGFEFDHDESSAQGVETILDHYASDHPDHRAMNIAGIRQPGDDE